MRLPHIPLIAILATGGCSVETDLDDVNPFASEETESATDPAITFDRVAIVESLEIGQAHRGRIAQVSGLTTLQGYYDPALRLLNGGAPDADGYIVMEFVARPPEATALNTQLGPRRVVAALFVPQALAEDALGVRVLGAENSVARPF